MTAPPVSSIFGDPDTEMKEQFTTAVSTPVTTPATTTTAFPSIDELFDEADCQVEQYVTAPTTPANELSAETTGLPSDLSLLGLPAELFRQTVREAVKYRHSGKISGDLLRKGRVSKAPLLAPLRANGKLFNIGKEEFYEANTLEIEVHCFNVGVKYGIDAVNYEIMHDPSEAPKVQHLEIRLPLIFAMQRPPKKLFAWDTPPATPDSGLKPEMHVQLLEAVFEKYTDLKSLTVVLARYREREHYSQLYAEGWQVEDKDGNVRRPKEQYDLEVRDNVAWAGKALSGLESLKLKRKTLRLKQTVGIREHHLVAVEATGRSVDDESLLRDMVKLDGAELRLH